jgi:GNAT superfamily N-acetyltransferase
MMRVVDRKRHRSALPQTFDFPLHLNRRRGPARDFPGQRDDRQQEDDDEKHGAFSGAGFGLSKCFTQWTSPEVLFAATQFVAARAPWDDALAPSRAPVLQDTRRRRMRTNRIGVSAAMPHLQVRLLQHTDRQRLDAYLRLYSRSFNPDERVSPRILRWLIEPSPDRVNPVHLFAAYLDGRLIGGACTLVLPMFRVVFGSYIFVAPALRGRGLGMRILREVLRQERRGPHGWNWRMYGEVTGASGGWWHNFLAKAGFRFFKPPWPLGSYRSPEKMIPGRLCYFPFRAKPPARFSQTAMLAYIHALFYGPEAMHRHLLPRLKNFIRLEA